MKWCRYSYQGSVSFGQIQDDTVIKVDGTPWFEGPASCILLGNVGRLFGGIEVFADATVQDGMLDLGVVTAEGPVQLTRTLIAHDEPIVRPRDAGEQFQYEGELVAVFGKRCRNVSKEDALDYVFGWTIGNDVSERTWQANDRTLWRAKNSDTFKPMGPWIVTDGHLDAMVTTIRLNGQVTETFKTNNMIFDAPTYISEVSKYCTIMPGDVMWMGTDGVPSNMKPGDACEIEISGIGVLRNPVVAE